MLLCAYAAMYTHASQPTVALATPPLDSFSTAATWTIATATCHTRQAEGTQHRRTRDPPPAAGQQHSKSKGHHSNTSESHDTC